MTYGAVELVFAVVDVTALFAVAASAVGARALRRVETVLVQLLLRKQHRRCYHNRHRQKQQNIIIRTQHNQNYTIVNNCQHQTLNNVLLM